MFTLVQYKDLVQLPSFLDMHMLWPCREGERPLGNLVIHVVSKAGNKRDWLIVMMCACMGWKWVCGSHIKHWMQLSDI